jgi:hypothetical protein
VNGLQSNISLRIGVTADQVYLAPQFPFSMLCKPIAIWICDLIRTDRRVNGMIVLELAESGGLYIALPEHWVDAIFAHARTEQI